MNDSCHHEPQSPLSSGHPGRLGDPIRFGPCANGSRSRSRSRWRQPQSFHSVQDESTSRQLHTIKCLPGTRHCQPVSGKCGLGSENPVRGVKPSVIKCHVVLAVQSVALEHATSRTIQPVCCRVALKGFLPNAILSTMRIHCNIKMPSLPTCQCRYCVFVY